MPYFYQEAEKYLKNIFWSETHDSSKLDIPKLIEEKLILDNKNKDPEYYKHRDGVIHVTSLSKCLRGVIHEMLGATKDSEIDSRKLGVFKAGNLFEDFIIEALKEKIVHQQRQYEYKYKNITIVGRSDYTIEDEGTLRIGENKSVHSDSFWMRQKEGELVAYQNQMQLQTYLWFERILTPYKDKDGNVILTNVERKDLIPAPEEKILNPHGVFSYISKDDCMVVGVPIRYNLNIVNETIIPAIEIINEGYTSKNPLVAPLPPLVVFSEAKHQYQKNWICKYCEYHQACAGMGWVLEATNLVTQRNKQLQESMTNQFAEKKKKPKIEVVDD